MPMPWRQVENSEMWFLNAKKKQEENQHEVLSFILKAKKLELRMRMKEWMKLGGKEHKNFNFCKHGNFY